MALTACTTFAPLPPLALTDLPSRMELTQVPFYPQEADQCGPAALAMVLSYAGLPRNAEQMRDEVYLPLRQGSLQIEMVSAVRRAGLVPMVLNGGIHELLSTIARGQPVIVLLRAPWPVGPPWHYAVAVGFDVIKEEIVLRSGSSARQVMSLRDFQGQWSAAHDWGLVVKPAHQRLSLNAAASPPPGSPATPAPPPHSPALPTLP